MVNTDELYIVNYCHPNCIPLKNICRLPKKEAFMLAYEMATQNPDTTAFYRFADFNNYYSHRMKQDEYLYNEFISLNGKPKEKHPLSFVLQGSEYLDNWFENGIITKVLLRDVPSEYISFTLGDSGATIQKNKKITMYTKEKLLQILREYEGTIGGFMDDVVKNYHYIEVQLWNDEYCIEQKTSSDCGMERIKRVNATDLSKCLSVIHRSFATVAKEFDLTEKIAPKHPYYMKMETLQNRYKKGFLMFGLHVKEQLVGFASLNKVSVNVCELCNLAILPEYRHKGYGRKFLDFCKMKAKELGCNIIEIDIIEENTILKNWYIENGFTHKFVKKFDYLPFSVGFMEVHI